ncbi:Cof-type HAD-IIB family hydrolase [Bacillus sp. PS06]|uniref:Cof-type HAD-IIB family hydrolase n=1 Tax=Bacillus sp. PS06 TaxID=2764176 RepID=UPI00178666C2|nr:HAD family hydrolase [Bacillus sp. PS06]MBD8068598.1 HAD family phosphatase [Bacillus sp. PS06]
MTDYSILFLDIDGTILTPDDTIQNSTKEAVKQVKDKGIKVFLATGRPLHEIWDIGKELHIESFIGYNGAYAIHQGQEVFNEPMPPKTVERFLQTAKQHGHEIILYTSKENLLTSLEAPIVQEFIDKFHLKNNQPFTPEYMDKVLGMTVINVKENNYMIYEDQHIHLSQVNIEGFKHSFDVIRDTVNKGVAVQTILESLSLTPEAAIAFGDGMNDKEMLSYVKEGFSMGNAHPDLHSYSKHQTTSVNDHGIFNGLKKLGLVE